MQKNTKKLSKIMNHNKSNTESVSDIYIYI